MCEIEYDHCSLHNKWLFFSRCVCMQWKEFSTLQNFYNAPVCKFVLYEYNNHHTDNTTTQYNTNEYKVFKMQYYIL